MKLIKKREYDFLSSIEVLVLDMAHIFLMQNWEHVINIFEAINTIPTKIETDISRLRHWSLKNHSRFYRQTLLFSRINVIDNHALFSKFCNNYAGQITLLRNPRDIIENVAVPSVYELHRFTFDSIENQSDFRFNYFVKELLPKTIPGTLIFISSYFDFVRLRNFLKRENEDIVQLHEYAEKGKVAKARQLFILGHRKLMLLTERFYFYYRYNIKGIKSILFYQLPINPEFFYELINMASQANNLHSKVLYGQCDVMRVQNIFGNAPAQKIITSQEKILVL